MRLLLPLVPLLLVGCFRYDVAQLPNEAPVAVVTAVVPALVGAEVVLDGSGSTDADGNPLTYAWTQESGAPVSLRNGRTAVAAFTAPPEPGTLYFTLVVDDGAESSVPGVVRVDVSLPPNATPVARVDAKEKEARPGETVVLDGSTSSDPDEGDTLVFKWEVIEGAGGFVPLVDADKAVANFPAPLTEQTLYFRLLVSDGRASAPPEVVTVHVRLAPNAAPVARVNGTTREVRPGDTVVLDGSTSSDEDGNETLRFQWEVIEGAGGFVPLVDADKAVASFQAPATEQVLFFRLTVSDGRESAPPLVVTVDVRLAPNTAPVARVAQAEMPPVAPGSTVVLDGSTSSDDEDDTLTFAWEQVLGSGEPVVLLDADKAVASFTAPSSEQRLFFRLTVSDGRAVSPPVVVRVDVQFVANLAPVLRVARTEITAYVGSNVVLDASASTDPEGDPLFFEWRAIGDSLDPVTLRDAGAAVASFTAPDRSQRLYFQVIANDGLHTTAPVVVRVDVGTPPNLAPLAVAALADQLVTTGSTVVLDGSGSTDGDADTLTFRWEQVGSSGEPVALNGASQAVASFTAPDRGQRLFFRLTVNDGKVDSLPVVVRVIVNAAPVALTGVPLEVNNQSSILVAGEAFDPDNDVIRTYRWRVASAPTGGASCVAEPSPCLFGADSPTVSFTPPAKGDYVLQFSVNDGLLESNVASHRVRSKNRAPVAAIGASATAVFSGAVVALNSTASLDPDGDAITAWTWLVTGLPSAGSARFTPSAANVAAPTLTLVGRGNYFVSLEVKDADGQASTVVTQRLEVQNSAPVANAGTDFATPNGTEVVIQGRATDPDGDSLTYAWTLVDYPTGGRVTLADTTLAAVRFTPAKRTVRNEPASCLVGECYVLELVASDGLLQSVVDRVTVTSLNRAPSARAGPDQVNPASPVVLDGSTSTDPDGDAIASYTWTQVNGPDVTEGAGTLVGQTVEFRPPTGGTYVFDLRVSDGVATSAADRVVVSVDKANEAPVLSLARTQVVVDENAVATGLDASATVDPDGDDFTVAWRRISGSTSLPSTLAGVTPTFVTPTFNALLASGNNTATYEVTASDGELTSTAQNVVVAVAPGSGWVIVSAVAAATDTGVCGTRATPCASPHRAVQLIDPDANGAGDGRGLLIASGNYRFGSNLNGVSIPGGTRVLGGRDPTTFGASTKSEMRFVQQCSGVRDAFFLGPNATNVTIDGVRVVNDNDCDGPEYTALRCNGCGVTIRDSEFVQTDRLTNRATAILVNFAAANVLLQRVTMRASRATGGYIRGLYLLGGGRVVAEDSSSFVTTVNNEATAAYVVEDSRLTLRRCLGEVNGSTTAALETKVPLYASNGTVSVESSVLVNSTSSGGLGAQFVNGGNVSILYSTLLGVGGTSAVGNGIRSTEAINLMGNIISDFPVALNFSAAAALRSRVYENSLVATGTNVMTCNGAQQTDAAVFNAAAGTACNASTTDWSGNIATRCPLVNVSTGDYRLNTGITNPCVDAGLRSTAAGVAPAFDYVNSPRSTSLDTLDLGAFESN